MNKSIIEKEDTPNKIKKKSEPIHDGSKLLR